MLYLDTSALLKLCVLEEGSARVQEILESQDHPLPLWEIQEFELTNALRLKAFRKELTEEQVNVQLDLLRSRKARGLTYFPALDRSALALRFEELSRTTTSLGSRTFDVLHVACAVTLGASAFLTFDLRQAELARFAGLELPIRLPSA